MNNNTREIKFRFWNTTLNRWERDFDVLQLAFYPNEGETFPTLNSHKPEKGLIIQQFTGLKDSKGKEIYEGDIVSASFYPWGDYEGNVKTDIRFLNGCFGMYKQVTEKFSEFMPITKFKNLEVIGNIFENPNLIKEKN